MAGHISNQRHLQKRALQLAELSYQHPHIYPNIRNLFLTWEIQHAQTPQGPLTPPQKIQQNRTNHQQQRTHLSTSLRHRRIPYPRDCYFGRKSMYYRRYN